MVLKNIVEDRNYTARYSSTKKEVTLTHGITKICVGKENTSATIIIKHATDIIAGELIIKKDKNDCRAILRLGGSRIPINPKTNKEQARINRSYEHATGIETAGDVYSYYKKIILEFQGKKTQKALQEIRKEFLEEMQSTKKQK